MSDLQRRLEALEKELSPASADGAFEDWPAEDQLEDILDALRVHRCGGTVYPATDRELSILSGLHAYHELEESGGVGELQLPSGAVVSLKDAGDGLRDLSTSGVVLGSDLPEGVREYVERMEPSKQTDRERFLYEMWESRQVHREWVREHFSEERICARREETKQRDRELLESNRVAVGLPPLSEEQLTAWGLEDTRGEGVVVSGRMQRDQG